jgi:hypothetical protein
MKQRCRHCGGEVVGTVVANASPMAGAASPAFPIGYRFECSGAGQHGENNRDRVWYATTPDPVDEITQRGSSVGDS